MKTRTSHLKSQRKKVPKIWKKTNSQLSLKSLKNKNSQLSQKKLKRKFNQSANLNNKINALEEKLLPSFLNRLSIMKKLSQSLFKLFQWDHLLTFQLNKRNNLLVIEVIQSHLSMDLTTTS